MQFGIWLCHLFLYADEITTDTIHRGLCEMISFHTLLCLPLASFLNSRSDVVLGIRIRVWKKVERLSQWKRHAPVAKNFTVEMRHAFWLLKTNIVHSFADINQARRSRSDCQLIRNTSNQSRTGSVCVALLRFFIWIIYYTMTKLHNGELPELIVMYRNNGMVEFFQ